MSDPGGPFTTWDFDPVADGYDELVTSGGPLYARYDDVLDAVARLAAPAPARRILDIGTGTGNLALRCLREGAHVVGLDPSARMLERAREKTPGVGRAQFRRADQPFLRTPYPDSHFDAIVSTYAFHHVPRARKRDSIGEMLRVLKPGGTWAVGDLIFATRNAEEDALGRYSWLEQEYFARVDELERIFAQCGMELCREQLTPVTWVLWAAQGIE
jgi:putative AdoMet-dependent methyltransferase